MHHVKGPGRAELRARRGGNLAAAGAASTAPEPLLEHRPREPDVPSDAQTGQFAGLVDQIGLDGKELGGLVGG